MYLHSPDVGLVPVVDLMHPGSGPKNGEAAPTNAIQIPMRILKAAMKFILIFFVLVVAQVLDD